ncbi:hypothetical protein [Mycoplasma sp. HU2014]|uniref:hypothetical protein n=1 Tax=Mycoplasma sp. HU2014 TaxID=1664275 RepID=UPI0006A51260|nr:hypothetical protein [Mycoplasma sp. HU2014]KNG79775.1 hypothetical protein AB668_02175 [Mycoplasma sp. HU2014]
MNNKEIKLEIPKDLQNLEIVTKIDEYLDENFENFELNEELKQHLETNYSIYSLYKFSNPEKWIELRKKTTSLPEDYEFVLVDKENKKVKFLNFYNVKDIYLADTFALLSEKYQNTKKDCIANLKIDLPNNLEKTKLLED